MSCIMLLNITLQVGPVQITHKEDICLKDYT